MGDGRVQNGVRWMEVEMEVLIPYCDSGNGARKCIIITHTSSLDEHNYQAGAFPL